MKKILSAIFAAAAILSLVSCGKDEPEYLVDGDLSPSTDLYKVGDLDFDPAADIYPVEDGFQTDYNEVVSAEYVSWRLGETPNLPYTDFTGSGWFEMYFEDFRDPDNPLYLSNGTFDDAVVISPAKYAYFNGGEYVDAMSGWVFPVAHEDQCIGIIAMSGKIDDNGMPIGSSSQSYSAKLNKALENGKVALFRVGDCENSFAIAEDGTVFNLTGDVAYKGDLSFADVDKGYNVISADSFSTAVYPIV